MSFIARWLGITELTQEVRHMSQALAALRAQVKANTDAEAAATALIQGIAAKLQAAIDNQADPAEIQALVTELASTAAPLAAAVVANTPAAPAVDTSPAPVTP
jgi:hypothetical protein